VNCQASFHDMERFRSALIQQIGLRFDNGRLGFLGDVLQRRLDNLGCGRDAYLWDLEAGPSPGEIGALARELTIGETYFFRNNEQFRALAEVVLPERIRLQQSSRSLRLLSAGCSSGEEPYTMAIIAREALADPSWKVAIRAVDLNPASIEKATRARYSAWALRETPADIRVRWFCRDGRDMVLANLARETVTFEQANLASNDEGLWRPAAYDAVFCRNVLMYFEPAQMRTVIARIARSLAPGGYLFLGHAETLRDVSDAFHLRHTHGTFYYQVKDRNALESELPAGFPPLHADGNAPVPDHVWFDAIRLASERVSALLPASAASARSHAQLPPFDLAPALALLRQERFAEALAHVRAGTLANKGCPDLLLLEATLLAHAGQFAAADHAASKLLVIDEFNAGAHYVLGLCGEQSEDRERAGEHHRVAAYLDPAFAMPRLRLGLLARRAGKGDVARRELAQALFLLEREDASRLLLFGGGFTRDALIGLGQAALKELGGRR
jgi:chemotaxis protein methyltransferase CheR